MGVGLDEPGTGKRFSRTRESTEIARRLRREVSKTERKLWFHLQASKMGAPFRRQHEVGRRFPDYCCVPLRLLIEVDGPTHSTARDASRDHLMRRRGYDVLRFSVQEVDENLDGVIETIYAEVQLRLLRRRVKVDGGAG